MFATRGSSVWRRALAGAIAVALQVTTPAFADDVYYHRSGATWDEYEADVSACGARVAESHANVVNQQYGAYGYGGIGAVIGGAIAQAIMAGGEQPRQLQRNNNYCMALRGWTVLSVDDLRDEHDNLIDIDSLTDPRIQAWFAQETPPVGRVALRPKDTERGPFIPKGGTENGELDSALPPPITLEAAVAEREARRRPNRN